jgi:hypothetical protein
LTASYYWSKPRLGPVVAKKVAELFEGDLYQAIRETPPELVFQLHLLDVFLWKSHSDLSKEKVYIRNLKSYAYLAVFSLAVRALAEVGAKWGDAEFTALLNKQRNEYDSFRHKAWRQLTKRCVDHIIAVFKKESGGHARRGGEALTYANYFKNQSYVTNMLRTRLSRELKRDARSVFQD